MMVNMGLGLGIFVIICFLFIIILLWNKHKNLKLLKTVTSPRRGTWSERDLVLKLLKYGIPSQTIFHDLYVRCSNGYFSQIDVVVPTKAGIIVFEVKDYSGWLFGKGNQSHWCQVLAYGKEKHKFYNPVKQNETHIKSLRQSLNTCISTDLPIYSVIVFYGDCRFRDISSIPNNTFVIKHHDLPQTLKFIMDKDVPVNYLNKREVLRLLRDSVMNGENPHIVAQHRQMVCNVTYNYD